MKSEENGRSILEQLQEAKAYSGEEINNFLSSGLYENRLPNVQHSLILDVLERIMIDVKKENEATS